MTLSDEDRIEELQEEIERVAREGLLAAIEGNVTFSEDLAIKTLPLIRELAKLTKDKEWERLAKQGERIIAKRRGH